MLSKENLKLQFHDALRKISNTNEISIEDDEKFDDYGLDSLDRMNLLLEIEERIGYDLGELDLNTTNTFNLLYNEIAKKAANE